VPLINAQTIGQHGATWPQISRALEIINVGRELERHRWTEAGLPSRSPSSPP
jgi:hypothetical protein